MLGALARAISTLIVYPYIRAKVIDLAVPPRLHPCTHPLPRPRPKTLTQFPILA